MRKSARAMRRVVLRQMFDLLEERYGIELDRAAFMADSMSLHEIDAALSFKSDPHLEELRGALDRIDDGSFGVCIGCKTEIDQRLLVEDPARRICEKCEKEYNRSSSVFMPAHMVE